MEGGGTGPPCSAVPAMLFKTSPINFLLARQAATCDVNDWFSAFSVHSQFLRGARTVHLIFVGIKFIFPGQPSAKTVFLFSHIILYNFLGLKIVFVLLCPIEQYFLQFLPSLLLPTPPPFSLLPTHQPHQIIKWLVQFIPHESAEFSRSFLSALVEAKITVACEGHAISR